MEKEVFISTNGSGSLVAECGDIVLYLAEFGLERFFGFGERVELEDEPQDVYELADMLEAAIND